MIAGQALIAVFVLRPYTAILRDLYWLARTRGYKKSRHAGEIAEYVRRRYRVKIGHQKASIIESLAGGGHSPVRLAASLSLPLPYVRTLLRGMRDDGLVDGGGLDPALGECVEEILGGAGRGR